MRNDIFHLIPAIVLSAVLTAAVSSCNAVTGSSEISRIEEGFANVPDSVRLAVYWYWLSDNISREGVVKDLQAMKKAGISRAFIGNIGTSDVPYGPVKFMSDEWWEVTRTALKTASDLDIEIGMFNCPGWSQSGGPWVSEDQSMRYVAFKEDRISGDGKVKTVTMPDVPENRIIDVYAFPSPQGSSREWTLRGEGVWPLKTDTTMTVRTMLLYVEEETDADVRLLKDGKPLREFYFDRSNFKTQVGFVPGAPYVLSIPAVKGGDFSIELKEISEDVNFHVVLSEVAMVEEYPEKTFQKMFQGTLPEWDEYMWKTPEDNGGFRVSLSDKVDLKPFVAGGKIEWLAPDGDWTVVTAYMKTTGQTNAPASAEATGLEVDKMSGKHIRDHFNAYLGDILHRIPAEERRTFDIAVEDSYETGGTNWTDDMAELFKKAYGYDPVPYLPALQGFIVESPDVTDRFLWDLRRLVSDLVAYEYVGVLRDICHENGLKSWLENYGHWGFPAEFLQYGGQSDQVAGEFWAGEGRPRDYEPRAASSCAHIYGKRQVWAESCTSGDRAYQRYPETLKMFLDHSFTAGVNSTLLHLYVQQPDDRMPGINAWFGTEFNRHNTWFRYFDMFSDYLRRCNFLLQQGDYVADVAYYIGEDAPKMTGICNPPLPEGYSFDFINAEVLCNHARVEDGSLVLDSGMRYRLLVLPPQKDMRPEVLKSIVQLVRDGLTVTGPMPERSPSLAGYPKADETVKSLASLLWRPGNYGKGRVYPEGTPLSVILSNLGVSPDFLYFTPDNALTEVRFLHRRIADAEIYFISNEEPRPVHLDLVFRNGKYRGAEIWDPVTGGRKGLDVKVSGGSTSSVLDLDKYGSTFIVLRNRAIEPVSERIVATAALPGPWKVTFEAFCGNEGFEREFAELQDWAASDDAAVRYYSGVAHYETEIDLDGVSDDNRYELDLGRVMVMGRVKVNGQDAGGVWTEPYRVDVTGLLHEGSNTIEVELANNWMNRLMGERLKPAGERKTFILTDPALGDGAALQESGLIGPVVLKTFSAKSR